MADGRLGAILFDGPSDEMVARYLLPSDRIAAAFYCQVCMGGLHRAHSDRGRTADGSSVCTCRGECVAQGGYQTVLDPVQPDVVPFRPRKRTGKGRR